MSYEFEGCSDNVQYGIGVSREFIDAAERARNSTELATINLHNNRAGREVGGDPGLVVSPIQRKGDQKRMNIAMLSI